MQKRPCALAVVAVAIGLQARLQARSTNTGGDGGSGDSTAAAVAEHGSTDASGARAGGVSLPDLSPYDDGNGLPAPQPESRLTGLGRYDGGANREGRTVWVNGNSGKLKAIGVALAPLDSDRSGLTLNAAYLGRASKAAPETASPMPNNVWSKGLTGRFWDQRFKLHGEYAAGRKSATDDSAPPETGSGQAYDLHMQLQPDPVSIAEAPLHWRMSLDKRAAQGRFWSLGEDPGQALTERFGAAAYHHHHPGLHRRLRQHRASPRNNTKTQRLQAPRGRTCRSPTGAIDQS